MKKILTVIVTISVLFVIFSLLPVRGEGEIYREFIRLHVIANSDSEEDQELKYSVRDEVVQAITDLCKNNKIEDVDAAKRFINENINEITDIAQVKISEEGYLYDVAVEFSVESYPTKNYESFAFPAGRYLSLQIKIGEAEGENWWCVLFPPLCLSAATESFNSDYLSVGFTGEQYKIITNSEDVTYNIRFKVLESIEKILS